MAVYTLRLLEDKLGPGQEIEGLLAGPSSSPAGHAVTYVVAGSATVTPTGGEAAGAAPAGLELGANQAWHGLLSERLAAGAGGAHLLRFELLPPAPGVDAGGPVPPLANELAAATLDLDHPGSQLLRCDRVDFPPGGIAYLHTHAGSGIRCLLSGDLLIESEQRQARTRVPALGAWFERAGEPVLATASATATTAFVRVMVLPAERKGQRSIRYLDPVDQDKPKLQRYTLLVDDLVELRA